MTAESYVGGVMASYGVDLVQDAKDRMTSWTRDTIATALDAQTWELNFENDWDSTTTTDGGTSTTEGRDHDAVHQLTQIDPTPASPGSGDELGQVYDPKGNLSNDGMGRALVHDFDNQLSQVTVSPGSSQGTPGIHTYGYDALGRRVSKTVNNGLGGTTVFVCSGGQVLAEYTAGATPADPGRKYIYGAYIDEPVALVDYAVDPNGRVFFYHRNRQFSIVGLTNANGVVVERYAYDAYGRPTILAPDGVTERAVSGFGNPYLHTGRRFDRESGLYYYRARYYGPVLGRFLERDPLGYPDGLNGYAAYHVMYGGVDPSGEALHIVVWGGAKALGWVIAREAARRAAQASAREAMRHGARQVAARQATHRTAQEAARAALLAARQAQAAARASRTRNCKKECTITQVPRRGGNPVHDAYAARLGPGEWRVTTPEGLTTTFDARQGNIYYEAKTGHRGWINDNIHLMMKGDRFFQFTLQQLIAVRCKLVYIIAVDNEVGAKGLKKHLPIFPIQHIP